MVNMTPRIGICGSHRTGKTTLAETLVAETGLTFVKTSTSQIFAQHNLHPAQSLDFKTRLWIQNQIIETAVPIWQAEQAGFITDRTPMDFIAYTLADIQGITTVDFVELEAYLRKCFTVTNQIFTQLVVLQPAIPLIYAEGKAALNKAYIEHLNILIQGLCADERLTCPVFIIKRDVTSITARMQAILDILHK